MSSTPARPRMDRALLGILVLGAALRYASTHFHSYHPDEKNIVTIPLKMLAEGTLEPSKMNYGTFALYLQAIVLWFERTARLLAGLPPEVPVGHAISAARFLSALSSTATLWVTWHLTREVLRPPLTWNADSTPRLSPGQQTVFSPDQEKLSRAAAIVATAALAVSFVAVQCAHYATVDSLVTLLVSASLLCTLRAFNGGQMRYFVLAGICAGLATATKYTGCLSAIPLALVPLVTPQRPRPWRHTLVGLICVGIFFLVGMPYALLRYDKLIKAVQFESHHYSTGGETIFALGDHTWLWNLEYLFYSGMGPGLLLMSFLGILFSVRFRSRPGTGAFFDIHGHTKTLLIFSYIALVYLFVSRYTVRFDRNLLPIVPSLCVFAGVWFAHVYALRSAVPQNSAPTTDSELRVDAGTTTTSRMSTHRLRRGIQWVALVAIGLSLLYPMARGVVFNWQILTPHPKGQLKAWRATLPATAKIAEHGRMQRHPLRYYINRNYDYMVLSSHSLEPVAAHPERYPNLNKYYREFFTYCTIEKEFRNPWFESDFFAPHHLLNSATVNAYHGPTLWVLKVPNSVPEALKVPSRVEPDVPAKQNNSSEETEDSEDGGETKGVGE